MAPDAISESNIAMHETTLEEADTAIRILVDRSVSARKASHSPYSKFAVGAAILCKDGTIFTGCNVENASYGLTICGERTAVVKAVSEGQRDFEAIAVSAVMGDKLATPCGACRQVLAEFNPRIKVYLHNPDTQKVALTSLLHLLPDSFNPQNCTLLF